MNLLRPLSVLFIFFTEVCVYQWYYREFWMSFIDRTFSPRKILSSQMEKFQNVNAKLCWWPSSKVMLGVLSKPWQNPCFSQMKVLCIKSGKGCKGTTISCTRPDLSGPDFWAQTVRQLMLSSLSQLLLLWSNLFFHSTVFSVLQQLLQVVFTIHMTVNLYYR